MLSDEFLIWLKSKNPDDKYSFYGRENCALAQFGKYYLKHNEVHGSAVSFKDYKNKKEYVVWPSGESSDGSSFKKVQALIHSTTFGELLSKLEEFYGNKIA